MIHLEKNSNQNFAPDTKRPSKKERLVSTFFTCVTFLCEGLSCSCDLFRSRLTLAYPQSAYLDVSVYICNI